MPAAARRPSVRSPALRRRRCAPTPASPRPAPAATSRCPQCWQKAKPTGVPLPHAGQIALAAGAAAAARGRRRPQSRRRSPRPSRRAERRASRLGHQRSAAHLAEIHARRIDRPAGAAGRAPAGRGRLRRRAARLQAMAAVLTEQRPFAVDLPTMRTTWHRARDLASQMEIRVYGPPHPGLNNGAASSRDHENTKLKIPHQADGALLLTAACRPLALGCAPADRGAGALPRARRHGASPEICSAPSTAGWSTPPAASRSPAPSCRPAGASRSAAASPRPPAATVATVATDNDGRYLIERLTDLPSARSRVVAVTLVIYQRGYVAYRSDRVFDNALGGARARTDFSQHNNLAKLDRWTGALSHVKHVRFVGGSGALKRALGSEVVEASLELTSGPVKPAEPVGAETAERAAARRQRAPLRRRAARGHRLRRRVHRREAEPICRRRRATTAATSTPSASPRRSTPRCACGSCRRRRPRRASPSCSPRCPTPRPRTRSAIARCAATTDASSPSRRSIARTAWSSS